MAVASESPTWGYQIFTNLRSPNPPVQILCGDTNSHFQSLSCNHGTRRHAHKPTNLFPSTEVWKHAVLNLFPGPDFVSWNTCQWKPFMSICRKAEYTSILFMAKQGIQQFFQQDFLPTSPMMLQDIIGSCRCWRGPPVALWKPTTVAWAPQRLGTLGWRVWISKVTLWLCQNSYWKWP